MSYRELKNKITGIIKVLKKDFRVTLRGELKDQYFRDIIGGLVAERLQTEGKDSTGKALRTDQAILKGNRAYSPNHPNKAFEPFVNLYETGAMINSVQIIYRQNEIYAKYDLKKGKGNVFDNFELSYTSEKDFHDKVFSLSQDEIDILNSHLLTRIIKFYEKIFN